MVVLTQSRPPNREDYEHLCDVLSRRSRIRAHFPRSEEVDQWLDNRLQATGCGDYQAYCHFLESTAGEDELSDLLAVLARKRSGLFACRATMNHLANTILPDWVGTSSRRPGDVFRLWIAGCSSGEEAYSLAVVLADFFSAHNEFSSRILASDSSNRMIRRAREGVYAGDDNCWPNPDWQRRYFVRGMGAYHGLWRVKEEVKQMVSFRQLSLFDAQWPFTAKMDAIYCPDILLFDEESRERLVYRFAAELICGGALLGGE